MKRRDALKTMGTLASAATLSRLLPACVDRDELSSIEQSVFVDDATINFQLLGSPNAGAGWTHIVAGRFAPSYGTLFFYNQNTGAAKFATTNGAGGLSTLSTVTLDTGWTQVVPGFFDSSSAFCGLLFYKPNGTAKFYNTNGSGQLTLKSSPSGWRSTWTQIVPGMFTPDQTTSLFFYSPSENEGEIWRTSNGALVGPAYQAFSLLSNWTHIVAGDFSWTIGQPSSTKNYSDLFFYNANANPPIGSMYLVHDNLCTGHPAGMQPWIACIGTNLPVATHVLAGNFGGYGNADLLFHNESTGALEFYSFVDIPPNDDNSCDLELIATLALLESRTSSKTTNDIVVAGEFFTSHAEDIKFFTGPDYSPVMPHEQRNWRAGTGGFADLFLYDSVSGDGDIWMHEPFAHPRNAIEGYLTSTSSHGGQAAKPSGSVLPGESITLHVHSTVAFDAKILRKGIGVSGEVMMVQMLGATSPSSRVMKFAAYRNGAGWPATATFQVPATWESGLYVVRLTDTAAPTSTVDLPFVVRATNATSKILMVVQDATYNAYNQWGGRSVYGCLMGDAGGAGFHQWASAPQGSLRLPYAFNVSFARPHFEFYGHSPAWQTWEVPFLRWMWSLGIPVDVCTARDLDLEAPTTNQYKLLIFVGHHEYWSLGMRVNTNAFQTAGGNVAFFAGNVSWWQVRFDYANDSMYCYKINGFDPDNGVTRTCHWFDPEVSMPEHQLTGVSWWPGHVAIANHGSGGTLLEYGDLAQTNTHWIWSGTGLTTTSTFGKYTPTDSVIGPEFDREQTAGSPVGISASLPGWTKLANAKIGATEYCTMALHQPGGRTFTAGTIDWALGVHAAPMSNITQNLIDELGPTWNLVASGARDIAVGVTGAVWAISNTATTGGFQILQWNGTAFVVVAGPSGGGAVRITVDSTGNPWVMTSSNAVFRRVGGLWLSMLTTATDLGAGPSGSAWKLGTTNVPNGKDIARWTGSTWQSVSGPSGGGGVRIAVDELGNPWIVDANHNIFKNTGGSTWSQISGQANDIGISPEGVACVTGIVPVGGGFDIYRKNPTGWTKLRGGAVNITVGPGAAPWITSSVNEAFRWG